MKHIINKGEKMENKKNLLVLGKAEDRKKFLSQENFNGMIVPFDYNLRDAQPKVVHDRLLIEMYQQRYLKIVCCFNLLKSIFNKYGITELRKYESIILECVNKYFAYPEHKITSLESLFDCLKSEKWICEQEYQIYLQTGAMFAYQKYSSIHDVDLKILFERIENKIELPIVHFMIDQDNMSLDLTKALNYGMQMDMHNEACFDIGSNEWLTKENFVGTEIKENEDYKLVKLL